MVRLENSVELLLENLQSCLSKIGLSQGAIESYETGSFITGKDAGTLNTGIKIFGDLHEKNKEAYDEIYETEQKIKDEAEKRKTQGIWRTVGGAVLIATGVACIVLTGGAAIPIVADVAVAVGSGTAVFGAADAIEGTQDIYYGSTGDIDSTAVNGIKDDLFQGNEDAYYLTENAFAFAASAMIPIGQASTAGNLTFKSTATIVAKEGISMGAGAGAQKITTDVTGNDTAGMVAGMFASGVTAKGLNGIEAEANKLAKAPKGIDGVTEGVGNLAEDVGKVVESGKKTGTVWDNITSTADNMPATKIPATFKIDLDGNINYVNPETGTNTLWTNSNATKHMGEYVSRFGDESWSIGTRSQAMLESYSASLNKAMETIGTETPGRYFGTYGNWELGINTETGVVYHARMIN